MPIILSVTPNLDTHPWSDLPSGTQLVEMERVGALPEGTSQGNPALIVQGTVDGKPVCFQTSLRNMLLAMQAFDLAYGPFDLDNIQAIPVEGNPNA